MAGVAEVSWRSPIIAHPAVKHKRCPRAVPAPAPTWHNARPMKALRFNLFRAPRFGRRTYTPFERRLRRSARGALYGSLALLVALLVLGLAYLRTLGPKAEDMDWVGVDFAAMPEVQLLQRYLQIDTSQPDADELAGARFLASRLEAAGMPYRLELMGEDHANLWAILEGESPEALVLHHHIDTDPVTHPEGWTHPPFSGQIDPPYIYGRGAYDMKGIGVAQLSAFLDLAASGRRPRRSVIFLATGSEEVGSDLGTKWILRAHPELAGRFWAFLTEGGVVESLSTSEVKYWGIEFAQKRYVDLILCSPDRERLEGLRRELIEERREDNYQVELAPEVAAFFRPYGPTRTRELYRQVLADPLRLRRDGPAFFDLPIFLRAMLRDEALPFPVEEAPGGGGYQLLVKLHLLPGSDLAAARRRLLPEWKTYGLTTQVYDEGGADHGSPLDHPLYTTLVEAMREIYPDTALGPYFLPWTATDSRFTRAAGIPSYGFSPFLVYSTETSRIGQVNERLRLPELVEGVGIYKRVVQRIAGGSPAPADEDK